MPISIFVNENSFIDLAEVVAVKKSFNCPDDVSEIHFKSGIMLFFDFDNATHNLLIERLNAYRELKENASK